MNSTSIVDKTLLALEKTAHKYTESSQVKSFQKACISFDRLIEQGMIKKRGYNLLTIDEAHLHKQQFNA